MTNSNPPFKFPGLEPRSRKDCAGCGEEFQGREGEELCLECQHRKDRPETADKYWTWRRAGNRGWAIAAYWPDREPLPEPGEQVTVHRKDGSTSVATIRGVDGLRYTLSGRAQVQCIVG